MGRSPFVVGDEFDPLREPHRLPTPEENAFATRVAVERIVASLADLKQRIAAIETRLAATDEHVGDVKQTVIGLSRATALGPSGRTLAGMVEAIFTKLDLR